MIRKIRFILKLAFISVFLFSCDKISNSSKNEHSYGTDNNGLSRPVKDSEGSSFFKDIVWESTENYSVAEPSATNSVRFAQVPNRPGYFIGRDCDPSGSIIILCTYDEEKNAFKRVKNLITPNTQIADNYSVTNVYDPTIMVYQGEVWVACECTVVGMGDNVDPLTLQSKSQYVGEEPHVSIILGVLDTENWRFDPSRISIPVSGYIIGDNVILRSASVPKLLVYNNIPYLYWTICDVDKNYDYSRIYSRGIRLVKETGGRERMWADVYQQTVVKTIACDDSRSTVVFDTDFMADNYTCDLFDVKVANGKIIASAAMGYGKDVKDPGSKVDNCYFPVFSETTEPLAYNTFKNSITNDQLRKNPCEYPTFFKNLNDNSTSMMIQFPNENGSPFPHGVRVFKHINSDLILNYDTTVNPVAYYSSTSHLIGRENTLEAGSRLISPNQRYNFVLQPDGNIEICKLNDRGESIDILWKSNTQNNQNNKLYFQYDSNLVLYSPNMVPLWESNTNTFGGVIAQMQDDGNFVMYNKFSQPVWQTDTVDPLPVIASSPYTIGRGNYLLPGEVITSPNGIYWLVYQGDGNLVLYKYNTPIWNTETNGYSCNKLVMQLDGNLVLYDAYYGVLWATYTQSTGASRLQLNDDGNLVLYREDNSYVWATGTN